MKRNADLIRLIVLAIQDRPVGEEHRFVHDERFADYDGDEFNEHIRLAEEAGLIEVKVREYLGAPSEVASARLTNVGHDVADQLSTADR